MFVSPFERTLTRFTTLTLRYMRWEQAVLEPLVFGAGNRKLYLGDIEAGGSAPPKEKVVDVPSAPQYKLDPQRPTEPPSGVVRFRTVVIRENGVEAAIAKQSAAEFPDSRRCSHPARRFRIEISKFLQLSILFFRQ